MHREAPHHLVMPAPSRAPCAPDAPAVTPERILQTGMAFWSSKALLSAVELDLFTVLAGRSMTGPELAGALRLAPRAVPDFPDTLVALGFLERDGDGAEARYRNAADVALFLDRSSPAYLGGMLEMANARLYRFWGDLTEALRTGQPQTEVKHGGESVFAALYADPERLEQFMRAMSGASVGNFAALAERFDFSPYRTLLDVGGATGQLACTVAGRHPHLACTTTDLPAVTAIARREIAARGLGERVAAQSLDFFADPFPRADVITMGMVLHDWNLARKRTLIGKAYDALPAGGCLIAIDHLIDDARRTASFGLLMSLNMLIETGDGFDYSGADFDGWAREAGFVRTEVIELAGPGRAAIAWK